jgi:hypothetical protein
MDEHTRRAALKAAARVALGTFSLHALLACGARTDYPDAIEEGDGPDVDERRAEATPERCTEPEFACLSEVHLPPANGSASRLVSPAELACCVPHILAAANAPAPDQAGLPGAARHVSATAVNCCKAFIADSVGKSPAVQGPADELGVRQPCCFGGLVAASEELYAYPLCTPWGPPVPPEMPNFAIEVA